MALKYAVLLMAAFCLCACAPGYTGADVKEGAEQDADEIGEQFQKDVKGTEKMFEGAAKDVEKLDEGPVGKN